MQLWSSLCSNRSIPRRRVGVVPIVLTVYAYGRLEHLERLERLERLA